jgi:hypothetical protein
MKQNITLSIDKNLIRKAKVMAAQKQTSISQMLSRELEKIIQNTERYTWAKKRAFANLRKGFHLGGKKVFSREELHER